jgi:hypothetical protein
MESERDRGVTTGSKTSLGAGGIRTHPGYEQAKACIFNDLHAQAREEVRQKGGYASLETSLVII